MNGQKFLSQILMCVPATDDKHVITLGEVRALLEMKVKMPVRVATTTALAAAYAAGTLTASANGALTIDGIAVGEGDRVLIKNQTDKTQNGVYTVTQTGDASTPYALTRADDFDRSEELIEGIRIAVAGGSQKGVWYLSSPAPLTLDASNLEFVKDTGSSQAVASAFAITGDGATAEFNFTHSFGTKDVVFSLYETATDEEVFAEFKRLSVNEVRVTFAIPPAVGEDYRLLLQAVVAS